MCSKNTSKCVKNRTYVNNRYNFGHLETMKPKFRHTTTPFSFTHKEHNKFRDKFQPSIIAAKTTTTTTTVSMFFDQRVFVEEFSDV